MADGSVVIDTKLDNDGFKSGLNKLGSVASSALKGVTVAIGTVSAAFGGLVTASVNARGEIEQQIGGVETLFKGSAEKVIKNAENAYKTAGMSASEYMQTVTSFSASLLQSLGGNTEKAADVADMALTDMADNANKFGTSMEAIQNAYQGFAKQNYTMLDNLKLGYGGTKTEMERLLKDAQKLTGVKYDISNLSDVYNAIHAVQKELGVTGTTAKEASSTLQGSFASMKASWNNFLSGSGDLSKVVETATDVVENVVRIVNDAIPSIITSITESMPALLELGGNVLNQFISGIIMHLPSLMESAGQILESLIQGILNVLPQLIPVALQTIQTLITGLLNYLPQIIEVGMQVILQLIIGIAQMLPELIPQIIDCVILIVETLLDNIDLLIDAGIQLILGLADGLIEAVPRLIDKIPEIIEKLFDAFIKNYPKMVKAGGELIGKLIAGIVGSFWKLLEKAPEIVANIVKGIKGAWGEVKNVGKYLIEGLWNGISGMASWVTNKVKSFANNILSNMKKALGIHSPSRVFRDEVGKYIALGVGEGFDKNIDSVYKQMKTAVDFETQKLSTSLTSNPVLNVERNANIQSRLESIDNNKEIQVNSTLNLDGKVVANTVNRVNARQKLQYGIA